MSKLAKHGFINYDYPDKFGDWLGYKLVGADLKKRSVTTALEITENHLSPANRVHGGVVSAFLDFSCGAAVFTTLGPEDVCSTIEIKISYFKPLHLSDSLEATSRVVFRGKRLCVVEGFVYCNKAPEPVAMASGTFNVARKTPKK